MTAYTGTSNVPLSVAVFLATDHYDHDPNTISATRLLKSVRQTVLSNRVAEEDANTELMSLFKSRIGTAIHDGIEKAWLGNYQNAMRLLGHSDELIQRVKVNATDLEPEDIPIYMEQRYYKDFEGKRISGKVDFVCNGRLEDFKSTSAYTWSAANKDEDYQLQGSIYRWLAPEIITDNVFAIQFLFTDWKPAFAASDPKYPPNPVMERIIPLLSLEETEQYVRKKLATIEKLHHAADEDIPLCNDSELWRKAPVYKYFKNPAKTNRSTKNFPNSAEAYMRLHEDGNVGIVKEVPGKVIACNYCNAYSVCKQKDSYLANGSL